MEKIKVVSSKTINRIYTDEWAREYLNKYPCCLDETGEVITEREVLKYRLEAYNSGNWEEVAETVTE